MVRLVLSFGLRDALAMAESTLSRAVLLVLATALGTGCMMASIWSERSGQEAVEPPVTSHAAATGQAPGGPRHDVASWYGSWHHGRLTASGEPFDMGDLTAAHRSLPLGLCVEVTHLANGRRVHVRVNDRGPYVPGRTIDLSHRAARELDMVDDGLARVRIRRAQPDACGPGTAARESIAN
ncbi:MAG: septal ring lytic transglycosylase RlpA family protein [Candidatus Rokuibacteriota bacterium]